MSGKKDNRGGGKPRRQGKAQQSEPTPAPTPISTEAVPITPPVMEKPDAQETKYVTKADEDDFRKETQKIEWWQIGLTSALVFVGLCQVGTYFWQALEMKWQQETMQAQMSRTDGMLDLMRADQRPWVAITAISITNYGTDKPLEFTVPFRNSGKTPARIIATSSASMVIDNATGLGIEEGQTLDSKLGAIESLLKDPGHDVSIAAAPESSGFIQSTNRKALSEREKDAIALHNATLYFFGAIKYVDVNNENHVTRFCRFYRKPADVDNMGYYKLFNEME